MRRNIFRVSSEDLLKIGDVYLVEFEGEGSEQRGVRPAVIFQNNIGNAYSPNVVVLPLTTALKKKDLPTHVELPAKETGLVKNSMVLCENPVCISKDRLGKYLTTIPDKFMEKIAVASLLASAVISFISPELLLATRERAKVLNRRV